MNFCPNCGSETKGMNFCVNCGMKLNDIDVPEVQLQPEKKEASEKDERKTGPIKAEEIAAWIPTQRYELGRGKKLEFEDRVGIIRVEPFHIIGKATYRYYRYSELEGYAVYENRRKIYSSEEDAVSRGRLKRQREDVIKDLDVELYFLTPERKKETVSFIGAEEESDSYWARSAYDNVDILANILDRIINTGKAAKPGVAVRKKPTYEEALEASRHAPYADYKQAKEDIKARYKAKEIKRKEYKEQLDELERQFKLDKEEWIFMRNLIEDDVFGVKAAEKEAKKAVKKEK